jgi:glycosyltransferase involved in cell wall biosynthesis
LSLIVHAPNVHRGGGKTLLLSLLQAPGRGNCLALVDERLDVPKLPENIEIIRFPPTVAGRISAERLLKARTQPDDAVLCLGNLPPLFRLRARRTVLFLQNRYLLDAMDTMAFPAGVRWRIAIERKWLRCKIGNVQQTVVQTPSMADAVRRRLGLDPAIAPFAITDPDITPRSAVGRNDAAASGFLYVASGEPHKNHRLLVEAWVLLARASIKPLLRLTLNPVHHAELTAWIEDSSRSFGLRIENTGEVAPQQLSRLYDEAGALIYPSFTESLGLPLLEARAHGLPIIASERDFVRDIVTPQQTFDPESALSIARAVRRFLGTAEPALQIRTPAEFLDFVQGG